MSMYPWTDLVRTMALRTKFLTNETYYAEVIYLNEEYGESETLDELQILPDFYWAITISNIFMLPYFFSIYKGNSPFLAIVRQMKYF